MSEYVCVMCVCVCVCVSLFECVPVLSQSSSAAGAKRERENEKEDVSTTFKRTRCSTYATLCVLGVTFREEGHSSLCAIDMTPPRSIFINHLTSFWSPF